MMKIEPKALIKRFANGFVRPYGEEQGKVSGVLFGCGGWPIHRGTRWRVASEIWLAETPHIGV